MPCPRFSCRSRWNRSNGNLNTRLSWPHPQHSSDVDNDQISAGLAPVGITTNKLQPDPSSTSPALRPGSPGRKQRLSSYVDRLLPTLPITTASVTSPPPTAGQVDQPLFLIRVDSSDSWSTSSPIFVLSVSSVVHLFSSPCLGLDKARGDDECGGPLSMWRCHKTRTFLRKTAENWPILSPIVKNCPWVSKSVSNVPRSAAHLTV